MSTTAERVGRALISWYRHNGRTLRIRERTDPYSVLVVEVMAQQTQIARVESLAERFFARFPTLADLAHAETAEVLEAWRGLGYNRRALALHRAAATAHASGGLPKEVEALEELPGIGPYTARAVAAIAYGGRSIPVDVNIARVVGRILGAEGELKPRALQQAADTFGEPLGEGEAAAWAQAAMDLAATHCTAAAPRCGDCPIAEDCSSAGRVAPPPRRRREGGSPFPATRRWLRGRIIDELRDAGPEGALISGGRGVHDAGAVDAALEGLVSEGLVEPVGNGRVRLPRRTARGATPTILQA
jgi:A/G-specific adenine glycosylase